MDFILSTDSTCDLSDKQYERYGVERICMPYYVDGVEYGGDSAKNMSLSDFYNCMRNGKKTGTSMVNEQQARDYFEKLLKQGKDVLHISFASALSGTYQCVQNVADELNKTNANKIYVVDSKCACLGEGLLVLLVADYAKTHGVAESYEYAQSKKGKIVHLFTVDTLKYLCQGGRVTKTSATVGNLLKIKPVLCVDDDGKLVAKSKVIGRKISLNKLVDKTVEKKTDESEKIIIAHSDCLNDAIYVRDCIEKKLKIRAEIGEIGNVIGGHSGPGTVAVFFVGENRAF